MFLPSRKPGRIPAVLGWGLVCLAVLLSTLLRHSFRLTAFGDLAQCLLLAWLTVSLLVNAARSEHRSRLFWFLISSGAAVWLFSQLLWTYFEVWLRHDVPNPFVADIGFFLHLVPIMGALAVRPDTDHHRLHRPAGTDFVLLLTWWTYLYLWVVIPWQYVWPDDHRYGANFDLLYSAEHFVLLAAIALVWYRSSGRWRTVYRALFLASAAYALASMAGSIAIDYGAYYTGSLYDAPLLIAMVMFLHFSWTGRQAIASEETSRESDGRISLLTILANAAAFSLPLFAGWAAFASGAPIPVRNFRLALTLGAIVVVGILRSLKQHQLQHRLTCANFELQQASLTDPLTGVRNRRFLLTTINNDVRQILRWHAAGEPPRRNRDLIFYLIDIDHFKEVNDRFGHDQGDDLLVQVAMRIGSAIRYSDVLIRWGGEEFLVISRFTDRNDALALCTRVLCAIGNEAFELKGGRICRTCSIGWAAFPWFADRPTALSYDEVLRLADRGLYLAKTQGRNQAVGVLPESQTLSPGREAGYVQDFEIRRLVTAGPDVTSRD